jgi:hypothetical protein
MMNEPVMNVVVNTAVAANGVSGLPWLQIGIVFVALVSGLVFFFLTQSNLNLSRIIDIQEYLFGSRGDPTAAAILSLQDTTSPLAQLKTQTNTLPTKPGETWCFLGEDNTGRWCVKVPLPSLCEPSRSYGGRDPCEMTLAQQLPLGLSGVSSGPPRPPASASIAQHRKNAVDTYAANNANTATAANATSNPSASLSNTKVV